MIDNLFVVILAGGSGTRFWPLSRKARPKQLLSIVSPDPMLRVTVDRVLPLVPAERVIVVANREYGPAIAEMLPELPTGNLILEPIGRNTAPAVGLAARLVQKRRPDGITAVLPADHLVGDQAAFLGDLKAAAEAAESSGRLITFGIVPTRPATGYGYLMRGRPLGTFQERSLYQLDGFKEKPELALAKEYVAAGTYFWNAGMFIWRCSVILEQIRNQMPELHQGLEGLAAYLDTPEQEVALEEHYPALPRESIDYGVMENAPNRAMIAAGFDWSDVGSWEAAYEMGDHDRAGNTEVGSEGKMIQVDASGSLVRSDGKLIALLGVKDLVVVETADALLIMDRHRAEDVGLVLDELKAADLADLL